MRASKQIRATWQCRCHSPWIPWTGRPTPGAGTEIPFGSHATSNLQKTSRNRGYARLKSFRIGTLCCHTSILSKPFHCLKFPPVHTVQVQSHFQKVPARAICTRSGMPLLKEMPAFFSFLAKGSEAVHSALVFQLLWSHLKALRDKLQRVWASQEATWAERDETST